MLAECPGLHSLPKWGSFDGWGLVRGALQWLGQPDPAESRELIKADSVDESRELLHKLHSALDWLDPYGRGLTSREIITEGLQRLERFGEECEGRGAMRDVLEAASGKRGPSSSSLGYLMRSFRGQVLRGKRLTSKRNAHNSTTWCVEFISSAGDGGHTGDDSRPKDFSKREEEKKEEREEERNRKREGWETSPASPLSPAHSECDQGDHDLVDVRAGGLIKTSCRRCGKFIGNRPVPEEEV